MSTWDRCHVCSVEVFRRYILTIRVAYQPGHEKPRDRWQLCERCTEEIAAFIDAKQRALA